MNRRDNCSQGNRAEPLLVKVEQRGPSEQEAETIYISSPAMVQEEPIDLCEKSVQWVNNNDAPVLRLYINVSRTLIVY